MKRNPRLLISNHKKINLIIIFWIVFLMFFTLTYFTNFISLPLDFLLSQLEFYFVLFLVFLSFFVMMSYKFYLNIDDYSINIKCINFFRSRYNYIDISNSMLVDYFFLKKQNIFNKILVVKFQNTESKKIIVRRFIMTLLKNNEIQLIKNKLEYIKKERINE
tara:strand:- start:589 stop:1074 length:486 start_codon:yes stop_codon:yes gene_type:complete